MTCLTTQKASSGAANLGRAEIFLARNDRVTPPSFGRNLLFYFAWAPGTLLIFINRSSCLQNRIDDSPRLLHIVLSRKKGGISRHRVAKYALVRIHFIGASMTAGNDLDTLALQCLPRSHHR